jgi:lysozyme
MMSEKETKDMIMAHEGVRNKPYKDSLGLWTVGVGHLIGDGKTLPDAWNREFSNEEVMAMFDEDYQHHRKAAEGISGFDKFNSAGQAALTDLTFNMGPGWISRFPNTGKNIAQGNAAGAAAGLTDSKWYGQVGSRAPQVVGLISQGGIQARDGGLADGPMTGYPATLHGNEAIIPLDPNSILSKLAKTSEDQINKEMNSTTTNNSTTQESYSDSIYALYDLMSVKFDNLISAIETGNDTANKIYKVSSV